MSDSTVFQAGQSLRRREMLRAAVAGTVAFGMGTASSGTVAAQYGDYWPEPSYRHLFLNPGLEALYNYVTAYSDGFTKDSVEDMTAENTHLRIYNGADAQAREITGGITNLKNYVRPDDPTASSQAEMVYSELRTTALKAVQEGQSSSEASSEGYEAAMEELTIPFINLYRQWNEHVYNIAHFFFTFMDEEEVEWDDQSEYDENEGLNGFAKTSVSGGEGLPNPDNVFRHDFGGSAYSIDTFGVSTETRTLPNGEAFPLYVIELDQDGQDRTYRIDQNAAGSSTHYLVALHPDDNTSLGDDPNMSTRIDGETLEFDVVLGALETIESEVSTEATEMIEEVMDAYTAGDIGDTDVLSSYDFVREYGDSDMMTRYTAELLAAGLDAQEDVSQQVTIYHPDIGVRTGRLFLSWDWDLLADWEYTYADGTFELDAASIDDEPDLELVFQSGSVTITDDDLEDGVADVDDSGLGDLEHVERHSEGELYSHIPVDTETNHWDSAMFLFEDDDTIENRTLDPSEPFEVSAVEDDGEELDKLELNGWQNTTRDPARALEEAQRTSEQYVSVSELEETAHGGGGGGGTDTNALLIGGGIIALVGMIIAALSSGDS